MHGGGLSFGNPHRRMTQDPADLPLQATHTGFTRIVIDDVADCIIAQLHAAILQAIGFHLPADKITPGDFEFLCRRVTAEADDFHTVPQGPRNRIQNICRRDEHDPAEIEGHGEVVVAKCRVLFGVEHFQ